MPSGIAVDLNKCIMITHAWQVDRQV